MRLYALKRDFPGENRGMGTLDDVGARTDIGAVNGVDVLDINLKERSYPIYVTDDYGHMGSCLKKAGISGKIVVITDTNVDRFQAPECLAALEQGGFCIQKHVIDAGEKNKNIDTVKEIYRYLMDLRLDRHSVLAALGGGVVGDITGFAAATFLRGINFIQIPTSLLAQADSSVGGKVGVDFEGGKNIIGAFYQPRLVYMNAGSLRTLPERELKSGLAEIIKHGMIKDEAFYNFIKNNIEKILNLDLHAMKYLARMNCRIKGSVVEQDEYETTGLRAVLNFGHTFGHAIESVSGFKLLHGECVSLGMVCACKMALYLGMTGEETVADISDTLVKAGLPIRASGLDSGSVYDRMFRDKKIRDNRLVFILPRRIGETAQVFVDDRALVIKVLDEILC